MTASGSGQRSAPPDLHRPRRSALPLLIANLKTGSLKERRVLFTAALASLISWIFEQGWEVAIDETTVKTPRKVWVSGERRHMDDAMHVRGSKHYTGEAADLNLYVGGQYISDGSHPAWRAISARWEGLHPACTAGIRFHDANHVSILEADRSEPLP